MVTCGCGKEKGESRWEKAMHRSSWRHINYMRRQSRETHWSSSAEELQVKPVSPSYDNTPFEEENLGTRIGGMSILLAIPAGYTAFHMFGPMGGIWLLFSILGLAAWIIGSALSIYSLFASMIAWIIAFFAPPVSGYGWFWYSNFYQPAPTHLSMLTAWFLIPLSVQWGVVFIDWLGRSRDDDD